MTLYNHVAANHSDSVKNVISYIPDGGNKKDLPDYVEIGRAYNRTYIRQCSMRPSFTVTTAIAVHYHYRHNRCLTVRENARFQSFSDNFRFLGSKTKQGRQVGNAVPPLLSMCLAQALKRNVSCLYITTEQHNTVATQ